MLIEQHCVHRVIAWILSSIPSKYADGCLFSLYFDNHSHMLCRAFMTKLHCQGLKKALCCWKFSFHSLKASSTLGHLKPWHKYSFKLLLAFSFWQCHGECVPSENDYMLPALCHWKGHQTEWGILNKAAFLLRFHCKCNFLTRHMWRSGQNHIAGWIQLLSKYC